MIPESRPTAAGLARQRRLQIDDQRRRFVECTNFSPFAADIQALLGLPVFDTVSLLNWFHAGLRPRRF